MTASSNEECQRLGEELGKVSEEVGPTGRGEGELHLGGEAAARGGGRVQVCGRLHPTRRRTAGRASGLGAGRPRRLLRGCPCHDRRGKEGQKRTGQAEEASGPRRATTTTYIRAQSLNKPSGPDRFTVVLTCRNHQDLVAGR